MVSIYVDGLAAAGDGYFWKTMEKLDFYFGTTDESQIMTTWG